MFQSSSTGTSATSDATAVATTKSHSGTSVRSRTAASSAVSSVVAVSAARRSPGASVRPRAAPAGVLCRRGGGGTDEAGPRGGRARGRGPAARGAVRTARAPAGRTGRCRTTSSSSSARPRPPRRRDPFPDAATLTGDQNYVYPPLLALVLTPLTALPTSFVVSSGSCSGSPPSPPRSGCSASATRGCTRSRCCSPPRGTPSVRGRSGRCSCSRLRSPGASATPGRRPRR